MTESRPGDPLPHIASHIGANYADSFGACRALLASMFELDAPSPEQRTGYVMDFAVHDFGPITLGTCTASPSVMVRSPQTIARTGVDHFHLQVYRSHGFVVTVDGAEHAVGVGDICMLDLARPAAIRTSGVDNLWIVVARELLAPMLADPGDAHGLILRQGTETNVLLREHLEEMRRQAPTLTVAEGLAWSQATARLLAGVVGAVDRKKAATRAELRRSQFRAICRRIDRQIADPALGASDLARQFHVTRPTLYRLFAPHGGIDRYILGRRLAGAFRELSDPALAEEKIAAVLYRWGFVNHTTAGRAFRLAYGLTPSAARGQALARHKSGPVNGKDAFNVSPEMPAYLKAFES